MFPSRIVALVPAYNEASSIAATIESLLSQTRPADEIVIIPNGCTDDTAEIARQYPVTVLELPRLEHRKSEALNRAWLGYAVGADMVVTIDADTILPPNAIEDWAKEHAEAASLGGSCAKFTVTGDSLLARLQKAEYSASIDDALRKGTVRVLPGAGCAFKGAALRHAAERGDRIGPWSYKSTTEDFELTYRMREMGYITHMSPTVRAYTDSMKTIRAVWGQRLKWQTGTIEDLMSFGLNRLTVWDWMGQMMGLANAALKVLLVVVLLGFALLGTLQFMWFWLFVPPALSVAIDLKRVSRIPHRDRKDTIIASTFLPNELFMLFRVAWSVRSWWDVLADKITKKTTDRWAAQYAAEGV